MRKSKNNEERSSLKQRIKEGSLPAKAQKELASLSKELGISKERLVQLCVMMYRMYEKKA
ncbi:MAG: hypothetical protein EOM50_20275 [Erysipelotrichia bacterium]|nr:hypothetical protein [Erysipelotrichia bacterium]